LCRKYINPIFTLASLSTLPFSYVNVLARHVFLILLAFGSGLCNDSYWVKKQSWGALHMYAYIPRQRWTQVWKKSITYSKMSAPHCPFPSAGLSRERHEELRGRGLWWWQWVESRGTWSKKAECDSLLKHLNSGEIAHALQVCPKWSGSGPTCPSQQLVPIISPNAHC
jgi:hypothetical protein